MAHPRTAKSRRRTSAALVAYWSDPAKRTAYSDLTRQRMDRPDVRQRISERTKAAHDVPGMRERKLAGLTRAFAVPELRRKISVATKAGMAAKVERRLYRPQGAPGMQRRPRCAAGSWPNWTHPSSPVRRVALGEASPRSWMRRDRPPLAHPSRLLARPNVCGTGGRLLRGADRRGFHVAGGQRIPAPTSEGRTAAAMAAGGPRHGDPAARTGGRAGRGRGSVTMTMPLPRYVIAKPLASGAWDFISTFPRAIGRSVARSRMSPLEAIIRCLRRRWHGRPRRGPEWAVRRMAEAQGRRAARKHRAVRDGRLAVPRIQGEQTISGACVAAHSARITSV